MSDSPQGTPLAGPVLVGVIMGSKSDWETLRHAAEMLEQFGVPHECRVVSAHRTPDLMNEYAKGAEGRGLPEELEFGIDEQYNAWRRRHSSRRRW